MADENEDARAQGRELGDAIADDVDAYVQAAFSDPIHETLEKVRDGTLTRAKAEEWAQANGRPPFASRPDPSTFAPRQSRYWTLAQATAWAVWRTDDAVRGVSEDYVSRCVEWVEVKRPQVRFVRPDQPEPAPTASGTGYELGTPKVPQPGGVLTGARHWVVQRCEPAPYLDPAQAKRKIIDALQAGDPLVARHGEGEAIDRHLWGVLSPFDSGDGPHDAVFYASGRVRFHRVRVERDAVLAVWPARPLTGVEPGDVKAGHDVVAPIGGSLPRIKGDKLRLMMSEPRMDSPNSDNFLAEARRRAREQGRSVDQGEVRTLYEATYGFKRAGRPPGRRSRSENPVE